MWTKFVSESLTITLRISLKLKLSGLYSNLFVIIFSLIFQKKLVVGENRKEPTLFTKYLFPVYTLEFLNYIFRRAYLDRVENSKEITVETFPQINFVGFFLEIWLATWNDGSFFIYPLRQFLWKLASTKKPHQHCTQVLWNISLSPL